MPINIPQLGPEPKHFTLEILDWPPDRQGMARFALHWIGPRPDRGKDGPRTQHFHTRLPQFLNALYEDGHQISAAHGSPYTDEATEALNDVLRRRG